MPTEQEILEKNSKVFTDGEVIFKEGEIGDKMFIIQKGKVKIVKRMKDVEKTLAILQEGDFFGEMAVIDKAPRSATAIALESAKLVALDEKVFELHMQTNPLIVKKILKKMSSRLREADKQIENLLLKDSNSRVANSLFNLAHKHGVPCDNGIKMDFALGPTELANQVGLSQDKVQEVIEKMLKAKVIKLVDNQIIIVSLESLEKYINFLQMMEEFGA